jgi:hypothetical protein
MLLQGVLTLDLMYDGFTMHTRFLLQQIWLIQTNLNQCCGMSWELVTHGISDSIYSIILRHNTLQTNSDFQLSIRIMVRAYQITTTTTKLIFCPIYRGSEAVW